MAVTNLETTIQLDAPSPRPRGLLLDEATEISNAMLTYQGRSRLGLGVQQTPWGVDPLRTGNLDCSADYIIDNTGPGADGNGDEITGNTEAGGKIAALLEGQSLVVHPAFKVVDGTTCSVMSFPDDTARNASMKDRLLSRMRTLMSATVAGELVNGWAATGPSFVSEAATLTASADIDAAAQEIEQHLADVLFGNQGFIHIPPRVLHQAMNIGWVRVEGSSLMTASGHVVIADAGYDGLEGPTTPAGGEVWIFASGAIEYKVSDTLLLGEGAGNETIDMGTNIRERLSEAYAQLAFDPTAMAGTILTA